MIDNKVAVAHFRRHMNKAPNVENNLREPWHGLSAEERAEDILSADWVPNRAMWRAQGFRNKAHAEEVLGA